MIPRFNPWVSKIPWKREWLPASVFLVENSMDRGFPGGSNGRVCWQCRRSVFDPWVRKIPWGRKWQLTSVFLPGKSDGWRSLEGIGLQRVRHDWAASLIFHGQRSLVCCSPWDRKESDTTNTVMISPIISSSLSNECIYTNQGWGRSHGVGNGNPLQDFCWKTPWTEEPGGLQLMWL